MADLVERREAVAGVWPVWSVLLLALGSGIVVFVGAGLVVWALRWPVRVAIGAAGGVVLLVWFVWVSRLDSLWFRSEVVKLGPEALETQKPFVTVEVSEPSKHRLAYLNLPGGSEALEELAAGLLVGRTFAEAEWCGRGRPYTRGQFRELRGQLLARGLAVWRSVDAPSQGVELTSAGRCVFTRIAEETRTRADVRPAGGIALLSAEE